MLFSTPLQLLVLCAVAVFAWLLGFVANPAAFNRAHVQRRLTREFTDFRAQTQGRMNNLTRHAQTLEDKNNALTARLGEAEGKLAALAAAPVAAVVSTPAPEVVAAPVEPVATPVEAVAATPEPAAPEPVAPVADAPPAETPAEVVADAPAPTGVPIGAPTSPEPTEGWLNGNTRDSLTRIDGIDQALDQRLFDLGITRFEDIEKLSDQDEMALELRLALPAGYITSRQWRTQAAELRNGNGDTLTDRFGTPPIAGV